MVSPVKTLKSPLLLVLGLALAWPVASSAQLDRHTGKHNRVRRGADLQLVAATFFGGEGVEEFVGVTTTPDGRIVATGNSWGPPFPADLPLRRLGTDSPWDVPLYVPGTEQDRRGRPQAPPATNPNRTGFLVFYDADLTRIEQVVRFGWGLASITASHAMSDGSLVIAGLATRNFRTVAREARALHIEPQPEGDRYGVIEYEGQILPGDVYVARMSPDLETIEWVWILEGHRRAPDRLFEGEDGNVLFHSHRVLRILADGSEIQDVMHRAGGGRGRFLGVHPRDGTLLFGGDQHMGTGREPWRKPILLTYTPEGELLSRVYDWDGPLVGHDRFRLVSDSAIRQAAFFPDGRIVVMAWSDGGNSVLTRNPVDLEKPVRGTGLGFSLWGAQVSSFAHFAQFDPRNYDDTFYCAWAAYMQTRPNGIGVDQIVPLADGSVAIHGGSARWLVQTTTDWYRATDHYRRQVVNQDTTDILHLPNGWPHYLGTGGAGSYLTVFEPEFRGLRWSSAMAMVNHTGIAGTPDGGVVAVGVATGGRASDGRDPTLVAHDVADWPGFRETLGGDGAAARFRGRLPEELWADWTAVPDGQDPPADLQERIFAGLNRILGFEAGLYDAATWPAFPRDPTEAEHLEALEANAIEREDLADLNRRLLEATFPDHIFVAPKHNRPAVRNAVQERFGGGFSDGHIYLLRPARRTF